MSRFLPFVPIIGVGSRQRLQPVFIDDLGWAVAEAVDNRAADDKVFEIGGPEVLTMKEIIRTGLEVLDRRRFLLPVPKVLMKTQSALLQFLPGPPLTPDAIDFITMDGLADSSELVETLGVRLRTLREGLATYLVA
jgi:NADH dehydrogenase